MASHLKQQHVGLPNVDDANIRAVSLLSSLPCTDRVASVKATELSLL